MMVKKKPLFFRLILTWQAKLKDAMYLTLVDAAVRLVIKSYTFISLDILSFHSVFLLPLTFYCTVLNSSNVALIGERRSFENWKGK